MAEQTPQSPAPVQPVDEPKTPAVAIPEPEKPVSPQAQTPVESDEKFFAALGYFAFLFVIPLIVKPKSAYCKFHARQSMVMFLGAIIVLIILGLIPWFGSILTFAIFALYVLAIYKAYTGEMWSIPVVSKFAGKMDIEAMYGKAGLAVGSIGGMKEKAAQLADQAGAAAKNLGKQDEAVPSAPVESAPVAEAPSPAAKEPTAPPTTSTSEKPKA